MFQISRLQKRILITMVLMMLSGYMLHSCYHFLMDPPHLDKEVIIDEFMKNRERFENIAQYSETIPGNFHISKSEKQYEFRVQINGRYIASKVENDKVHDDLNYIFNKIGYEGVAKEGSAVFFFRETGLRFAHGVIYFMKEPIKITGLARMKLRSISDKWYYASGE